MEDTNARSTFVRDFYAKSDRCCVHCYILAPQNCILMLSHLQLSHLGMLQIYCEVGRACLKSPLQ